ncbi:hypothetical protein [Pseudactinotalea terrae]|uniref:hypothetical protein n=1 Tax=Pseudactinotalea terrae TaxID=1743262 RepID=UPI0012E319F3|nr:hypothetical protein [Pseudactinotalea terrae]
MPKMIQLSRRTNQRSEEEERSLYVHPDHIVSVGIGRDFETVVTVSTGGVFVVEQNFEDVVAMIEDD